MVFLNNIQNYNSSSAWPTSYTANNSGTPALSQTPPLVNGNSATVTTSGTLRAKLRWVYRDGDATLAPNPPPQITIRETASAVWSYTGNISNVTGSGSADNGKGGQYQTFSGTKGGYSFGAWSTQINSSSGIVERSITISANASVQVVSPPTLPNATLQAGGYYTVQPDNRAVSITSTLGMTYYRGGTASVPLKLPQQVSPEGYTYAHSIKPTVTGTNLPITFTATAAGSWSTSPATYYHWYSSMKDYAYFGYMSPIQDLTNIYANDNFTAPERIHIHLIDGVDQVNAESYYFITFHDKYEDWTRTNTISHPLPSPPPYSPTGGSDWITSAIYNNSGPNPVTYTWSVSAKTTFTEQGTIENTLALQATNPAGYVQFQNKESITTTTSTEATKQISVTVTIPPNTTMYFAVAPQWEQRFGTTSLWGANGYIRDVPWEGRKLVNNTLASGNFALANQP